MKKKSGQRRNKERGRRKEEKMRKMNKCIKSGRGRKKKIRKRVGMTKWINKYRKKMIAEKSGTEEEIKREEKKRRKEWIKSTKSGGEGRKRW